MRFSHSEIVHLVKVCYSVAEVPDPVDSEL